MISKESLLKLIAESGYNIGYAAKKHLATYDIVEKLPGWIAIASLTAGIFALFVPELAVNYVSATFIVIGIASFFINFYTGEKEAYASVGSELTSKFHELRVLYQLVKSLPDTHDFSSQLVKMQQIQDDAQKLNLKKQVFLSDWYAHYKFFWQAQIGWMDEQLKFRFIRDKLPLGFLVLVVVIVVMLVVEAASSTRSLIELCLGSV